ncbi:MAG: desulfoferrodoxin [Spirochaetales bacterium]|nr:desulfoferrodoxin [Candidatus Physcosoma equi]
MKFFRCKSCENMVEVIEESTSPLVCCGRYMEEIIPYYLDASKEKHVPVIQKNGNRVTIYVGSNPHPMEKEHFIQWIVLETTQGSYRRNLSPWDEPRAEFLLTGNDSLIAVYAYCNIHGLWMALPQDITKKE